MKSVTLHIKTVQPYRIQLAAEFVFCYLAVRAAYGVSSDQAIADFRVAAARRRWRTAAGLPQIPARRVA